MLRLYGGELLYSWVARIAALYRVSLCELLKFSVSHWDLCIAPSPAVLPLLAEMTRLSSDVVHRLTIAASGIAPSWWNIRQVTPDAFSPNMEYQYRPTFKFCRLCLWHDVVSQGNEFLRKEWMVCIPTICPIHGVPMEDHCWNCLSGEFPIVVKTSRGFRLVCSRCGRQLATSDMPKKAAMIPQMEVLQHFESALSRALRNEGSLQFPGASVGPTFFLQTIEDLLWLLTRQREGLDQFFVHWLNDTVVRLPRRLYRNPGARPWLGDFPIQIRRGLIAHLAALAGGSAIRHRLFAFPGERYVLREVLQTLCPPDAKDFERRLRAWPQMLQTLVFEPHYTY